MKIKEKEMSPLGISQNLHSHGLRAKVHTAHVFENPKQVEI